MKADKKNLIGHLAGWITWKRFIFAVIFIFFLTSILFPFYWMVSSSFKTKAEIGGREPVYVPGSLRLDAFENYLIRTIPVSRILGRIFEHSHGRHSNGYYCSDPGCLGFLCHCQAAF